MRQTYENTASLRKEADFQKTIETAWRCKLQKMHKHHIIDFMVVDDDKTAKAFIEVKCLNKTYNQFPCAILSLSKFMKGIEYFNVNGDYFYRYEKEHPKFEISWGGRTKQTRDKFDIEPIVKIPMVYFKEI